MCARPFIHRHLADRHLSQNLALCVAHFRTISSNEPHPEAFSSQVDVPLGSSITDHSMIVQLGGDHIGILFSGRENNLNAPGSRKDVFHLWDWSKNICKAVRSLSLHACCLTTLLHRIGRINIYNGRKAMGHFLFPFGQCNPSSGYFVKRVECLFLLVRER